MDLADLSKLSQPVTIENQSGEKSEVDLSSRENPAWERVGILVPSTKKSGEKVFTLRNARQTREAMLKILEDVLELDVRPVLGIGVGSSGQQKIS